MVNPLPTSTVWTTTRSSTSDWIKGPEYGNFVLWSIPFPNWGSENQQNAQFDGTKTKFPAYRQRIRPYFAMYFDSAPLLLLEYVLASVSEEVANNIGYIAQIGEPKEALRKMWECLERAYGNTEEIVADILKNISKQSKETLTVWLWGIAEVLVPTWWV